MKEFLVSVCDDLGKPVYQKRIKANSLEDAKEYAWNWAMSVEARESWFTTYRAIPIKNA